MAIGDYDAISRAAQLMRTQPESGWRAIEDDVIAAVGSTTRGGWPLDVDDPRPGTARGALRVTDLVVGALLSRALRGDPDYVVTGIDVESEGSALQGISIQISGRYLSYLPDVQARVTDRCRAVVSQVVGVRSDLPISVAIGDVHR